MGKIKIYPAIKEGWKILAPSGNTLEVTLVDHKLNVVYMVYLPDRQPEWRNLHSLQNQINKGKWKRVKEE